jgi:hypothetical protein
MSARPLTLNEALSAAISDHDFVIFPLQPGDIGILSGADGAGKRALPANPTEK